MSVIKTKLSQREKTTKYASKIINSYLVNLCDELELLYNHEKKNLKELWKKRCNVAHESKLWKKLSDKDKKKIDHLCKSAIQFLERTKH